MIKVSSDWKTACISRVSRTLGDHKMLDEMVSSCMRDNNVQQQLRALDSGAIGLGLNLGSTTF